MGEVFQSLIDWIFLKKKQGRYIDNFSDKDKYK